MVLSGAHALKLSMILCNFLHGCVPWGQILEYLETIFMSPSKGGQNNSVATMENTIWGSLKKVNRITIRSRNSTSE